MSRTPKEIQEIFHVEETAINSATGTMDTLLH